MINALNTGSEKLLYSEVLNINVKGLASDDRTQKLTLNFEWLPNSMSHNKMLAIHLTDSNDPFFYYKANIGEDDFLKMKNKQELLVDFPCFPNMFTNLLNTCVEEDLKPQPKLILVLYMETNSEFHSTAELAVVEKNPFKHIVLLSVRLPEVSNSLRKQYITSCYCTMKEGKEKLEKSLSSTQKELAKQLQNYQEESLTKVRELEDLIKEKDDELCKKEQKVKDEIRRLKDDLSKRHKEEIGKLESKLKHKDNYHKNNLHEQETKAKYLEGLNKDYTDKLNEKSKMIKELKLKLDSLQTARQEVQNCLEAMEKENEDMHSVLDVKEEKIIKFSGDLYAMQLKVTEKEEVIGELRKDLKSVAEEKEELEKKFLKLKSQLAKVEENEKVLQKDEIKANEIIRKYMKQCKELKEQLKLKYKVVRKQDELIENRTKQHEDLEQKLASEIKCSEKDKHEMEKMKSKCAALEKELKDCQEEITFKNDIIRHLDEQICKKIPGQDPTWIAENPNNGYCPEGANEITLPPNQVPREHCFDYRYLQRHQPLPLHNPMDDEEPSFLQEFYANPSKSDPPTPFQPFSQHVHGSESTDRAANHVSRIHNESIQSGHRTSRSPSYSQPRVTN